MTKNHSDPNAPYIVIERVRHARGDQWQFFVSMVFASGKRRVVWDGAGYEEAILMAEELSREDHGRYGSPLLVDDRVLATPRLG